MHTLRGDCVHGTDVDDENDSTGRKDDNGKIMDRMDKPPKDMSKKKRRKGKAKSPKKRNSKN